MLSCEPSPTWTSTSITSTTWEALLLGFVLGMEEDGPALCCDIGYDDSNNEKG